MHGRNRKTSLEIAPLVCAITSSLGRPLHTLQSVVELLQVFRDAIKCHQSLYYDARILHRNISPGNIVMVDHHHKGQPKGILIDLDSAINLDEPYEADFEITVTRSFMAIGVLRNEPHTCRHDLESFLYVLLWTVITNRAEAPPEGSRLWQWSNGDWEELAGRKSLDMAGENIGDILGEFGSQFD
ncbi:serine/threonine-protein kinase Sgk2 [Cordyceps fumosorosea ARSEF 2679]|uniref:Serine/threonine-protein kinase Sgk2 n=1 Tax=Cordyceps fumosorosea (strain ARSEF 2679) TaxID=1081104 RepID=A0A166XMD2_CORFA|nr:serine/threonine-protein kinase Sgk2 [Cordyceps fumosorosea ARSEF 2679]OAA35973.1 serine/threonine-protein kinase Sgk2 [Cordyceps fumosorosea ARSEF 2679]